MQELRLIIIDVDGTLTDGGIYYDNNGNELKKFNVKDAAGFFAAQNCGIKIMVLTGRESYATERRMNELKVDYLYQGIKNKYSFIKNFIKTNHFLEKEILYIGDDLNDIPVMNIVGFVACPSDACEEVKKMADYVSLISGGHGAVRDCIEHFLKESNKWLKAVNDVYCVGI